MCGIGGIINLQHKNIDVVSGARTLSLKLRHRGPDDAGFLFFGDGEPAIAFDDDSQEQSVKSILNFSPHKALPEIPAGHSSVFVHRRLAIIDTGASGHQPMCDLHGKVWVTYNGEIYNYIELRKELEGLGYTFQTCGDTEVLLNAYLAWGTNCLKRFNGMFAFALWDASQKRIFCARDRSGVKPLYYYFKDGIFAFASELKALKALPFLETGLNERALHQYLLHNALENEPEGFLRNVIELPPSNFLLLNLHQQKIDIAKYFDVAVNQKFTLYNEKDFSTQCDEVRSLTVDAISKRLRSDVEVGCCLSGGIDSSVIAGVMAKHTSRFKAFTATFPGTSADESDYAQEAVKFSNADWQTVTPQPFELLSDYEKMVYALDIPIWSTSTYAQFRVMQLAQQQGIKVVLDGQGGDELFAGYPHYLHTWISELLNHRQIIAAFREGNSIGIKGYLREKLKRTIGFNRNKQFLDSRFVNDFQSRPLENHPSDLNGHLYHDFFGGLLKTYLRCEDRCSMHHSVESRTPFSDDTALIEKAFSLPAAMKIHNGVPKFILRESMKPYLPERIYKRRDKMGFVTPHNTWLPVLMKEYGTLRTDALLKPYFNGKFWKHFDRLLTKTDQIPNRSGSREETLVFKAITFSVWYRAFGI